MKEKLLVFTTIAVATVAIMGYRLWRNARRYGYDMLSEEAAKDAAILTGLALVVIVITALKKE